MKKFLKYIFIGLTLSLSAISCRDEEAVRFPELQSGANARVAIDPEYAFFNGGDIENTYVQFDVYTQNNDIEEFIYTATYNDVSSTDMYSPVEILRIPGSQIQNGQVSDVQVSAAELAAAFELPGGASYLNGGDNFIVSQSVRLTDGRVISAENSAPSITGGNNASFTSQFVLAVACASFDVTEAVGSYSIVRDDIEVALDFDLQVIAGPGENQVTLVDLFGHPQQFNVVLTVDPETSAATVAKQQAWDSGQFALPYGIASVEGSGTFFSCAGFLTLSLEHTVALGSFGNYTLELVKN